VMSMNSRSGGGDSRFDTPVNIRSWQVSANSTHPCRFPEIRGRRSLLGADKSAGVCSFLTDKVAVRVDIQKIDQHGKRVPCDHRARGNQQAMVDPDDVNYPIIAAIRGLMPVLDRRCNGGSKSGTAANVVPRPVTKPTTSDRLRFGSIRALVSWGAKSSHPQSESKATKRVAHVSKRRNRTMFGSSFQDHAGLNKSASDLPFCRKKSSCSVISTSLLCGAEGGVCHVDKRRS
jgi:hypothetical protein